MKLLSYLFQRVDTFLKTVSKYSEILWIWRKYKIYYFWKELLKGNFSGILRFYLTFRAIPKLMKLFLLYCLLSEPNWLWVIPLRIESMGNFRLSISLIPGSFGPVSVDRTHGHSSNGDFSQFRSSTKGPWDSSASCRENTREIKPTVVVIRIIFEKAF